MTVDWIDVLCNLQATGLSFGDIGRATSIPGSTLRGYCVAGSHPPHWRGEKLIAFWCLRMKRSRDQLPMTEVYLAPRIAVPRPARDRILA